MTGTLTRELTTSSTPGGSTEPAECGHRPGVERESELAPGLDDLDPGAAQPHNRPGRRAVTVTTQRPPGGERGAGQRGSGAVARGQRGSGGEGKGEGCEFTAHAGPCLQGGWSHTVDDRRTMRWIDSGGRRRGGSDSRSGGGGDAWVVGGRARVEGATDRRRAGSAGRARAGGGGHG